MGRMYATRKNKYSPLSNTRLVEEARKQSEYESARGIVNPVVPGLVDDGIVLDIDSLEVINAKD